MTDRASAEGLRTLPLFLGVYDPLTPKEEANLRDWVANTEPLGTPTETARLLATLDAARSLSDSGLDVERLARAMFFAFGWPSRRRAEPPYVAPLPDGITSGDIDNPEWARLSERVAAEYARLSTPRTETPDGEPDPELEELMDEQRREDALSERLHSEMDSAGYQP